MFHLYLFYLKNELKSFRTLIISSLYILVVILTAIYMPTESFIPDSNGHMQALELIFGFYLLFGFVSSAVLFSGIIAHDVETRNFRFILPHISRFKIYVTKYLVMLTYFLAIIVGSLSILLLARGVFPKNIVDICYVAGCFVYTESIVIFLSSVSKNEKMAMLLNTMISVLFPIMFMIYEFNDSIDWLQKLVLLTPYVYSGDSWNFLYLSFAGIMMTGVGYYFFKKKEI